MGMREVVKAVRRPKKTGTEKRRREKAHRRRLVAMGLPEETVSKLNSKDMRILLRHPARLRKAAAKG